MITSKVASRCGVYPRSLSDFTASKWFEVYLCELNARNSVSYTGSTYNVSSHMDIQQNLDSPASLRDLVQEL